MVCHWKLVEHYTPLEPYRLVSTVVDVKVQQKLLPAANLQSIQKDMKRARKSESKIIKDISIIVRILSLHQTIHSSIFPSPPSSSHIFIQKAQKSTEGGGFPKQE